MEKGLYFLPLGGAGEIGANCYLYGINNGNNEEWIIVDLGIGFYSGTPKAVDILLPDISFIEQNLDKVSAIFITHGHEDHIGGLSYLWERIKKPIYANAFTAELLARKMKANGVKDADIRILQSFEPLKIGSFELITVPIQHSIAENTMIFINTPFGQVVHTGDFKQEKNPLLGENLNEDFIKTIKHEKPLALVCDSTNIFNDGITHTENSIFDDMEEIIRNHKTGLYVTLFSSNIVRMNSLFKIAENVGRRVVLLGRAMQLYYDVALNNNSITTKTRPLSEDEAKNFPKNKTMVLCSGSQAEPRSQLWQSVIGGAKTLKIEEGDMVFFSSKIIPGNEKKLSELHSALLELGAEVVTSSDHNIHVSGHPNKMDVKWIYDIIKPISVIPMHGESLHLESHVNFAKENGYHSIRIKNGKLLQITDGTPDFKPKIVQTMELVMNCVDSKRIISLDAEVLKERVRVLYHGACVVSLIVDSRGRLLTDPHISTFGILEENEEKNVIDDLYKIIEKTLHSTSNNDEKIREEVRINVRRHFQSILDKKTVVSVHLFRFNG